MPSGVYTRTKKHKENLSIAGRKAWESGKSVGCQWKADNVGYMAKHIRIAKKLGRPKECWLCNSTDKKGRCSYQWANLSGKYKDDTSDWVRLCVSCHRLMDYGSLDSSKLVKLSERYTMINS